MINKFKMVSLAAALAVGGTVSASAATVSVISNAPTSWAAVDTANTLAIEGTWTTAPSTVSGSVAGAYRSPFDPSGTGAIGLSGWEQISYYTVGSPNLVASPAILAYNGAQTMLSILWGSIDAYNAIDFYLAGSKVDTVTGADLVAPGKYTAGASFVEITGVVFDQLFFRSNETTGNDQAAFEFASVSAVPIPAGGLLLLTALGGIAALRRRKAA